MAVFRFLLMVFALGFVSARLEGQTIAIQNGSYDQGVNTTLSIPVPGVLLHSSDSGGGTLTAVLVSGPASGLLSLNADGSFVYTPPANFVGTNTFTYRATDGQTNSTNATVTLAVLAGGPYFADNFTRGTDPGPLAPWVAQSGTWTVTGGTLDGTGDPNTYANVYFATNLADFSVQSTFQFPTGGIGGGIGGRLDPTTGAHYALWVYPETTPGGDATLNLIKFEGWSTWSGVPMDRYFVSGGVGTNAHTVKMVFAANQISAYFDGVQVMGTSDAGYDDVPAFANGGISFDLGTASTPYEVIVDNVVVNPAESVAYDDSYVTAENTPLTVAASGVLANDSSAGVNLTAVLVTGAANGTVNLAADGGFTYTPNTNFSGSDSFTYQANDGTANTCIATVSITVSPNALAANADAYSFTPGRTLVVPAPGVLANDTAPAGSNLTAVLVSGVAHGSLTLNANGGFSYTPTNGFMGVDQFTYVANDGLTNSAVATVTLTDPSPGILFSDDFTRTNDPGLVAPWIVESGTWTVTGGLLEGTNTFRNYSSIFITNTFTNYAVEARMRFPTNAYGGAVSGRVNPATGARYSAWVYPENSTGGSNVLSLVKFSDWTTFGYSNVNFAVVKTVPLPGVGTNFHIVRMAFFTNQIAVYYDGTQVLSAPDTEATNYSSGAVSLDFWIDLSLYVFYVDYVTVSPLVVDDSYNLSGQTALTVSDPGLLANDTEVYGTNLTDAVVTGPASGSLVLNTGGGFTYTPTNSVGVDSFTYRAIDGPATNIGIGTVTLTVNFLHNGPSLPAQTNQTVNEFSTLTVTNTATDVDYPATTLAYTLVSPPAGASISTNGIITWTPAEGQGPGTNVITTVVTDNGTPNLSSTNSFSVVVNDINVPPVLSAQTNLTISGLTSVVVTNTASDANIPAATLTYALVAGPTNAAISTNGVITWTPVAAQVPGTNVFTTVVTNFNPFAVNSQNLTATNSFTVTVRAVHNGPTLAAQSNVTVNEFALLTVTNTAIDSDVPALALSYHLVSPPTGAAIDTNGVITWTPAEGQGPSTNTITTVVTDSGGATNLSATNSFTVVVNDINVPPVLPAQANRTISGLALLTVTNTATDSNIPAASLAYGLVTGPTNATISANGVIAWTPVVAQVPSTNVFTTVVTNFNPVAVNAQHLTATNSFTVTVNVIHNGPSLPAQTNVTVNEFALLTVTNTALDADVPPLPLAYQLVSPPTGASISTNGVITWTPAEGQGPSTNTITTVVTDSGGATNLSATNSFTVVVNDINVAPVLPAQTNRTIIALSSLVVTNTATDANIPAVTLSYGLVAGPTNAVIDTNGVITWTPVVAQVPSTNVFTTVVMNFNPNAVNAQHLTATNSFTVTVNAVHNPPVLPAQANATVNEFALLTVTNTAGETDIPPLALNYQLVSPPAGASISTNGVITWTPSEGQGPGTNTITTVVTDSGTPALSATNSFTVVVNDINVAPVLPVQTNRTIIALSPLVVTNTAGDANIPAATLSYGLVAGPTNAVIDANGVITWTPVVAQVPSTNVFTTVVTNFNPYAVNAQQLTATNSFTVTVNVLHNPPTLPVQSRVTVNEFALLTVTNTAGETDIPSLALNYQLVSPPAGAVIDTNGVITWTPAEGQGPGTNTITTVVTDSGGATNLSATNSFIVVVNDINVAPVLPAQTNRTIIALSPLVVTNTATDANIPAVTLSYGLVSGPTNAVIDTNGVITWTPVVAQVPSTNVFTTVVTNFNPNAVNAQHLTATNSFTVTVNATHNGPVLLVQNDVTTKGLATVTVTNTAADSDVPPLPLAYQLVAGPGAALISTNGVITWTPGLADVPSTNVFTTVVTDNGNPNLSSTNSFTVFVNILHNGPVLPAQSNRTVNEFSLLTVTNTASDQDVPALTLTYQLVSPPTGAGIDTNGVITWTPAEGQGPSTNTITTVVTDSGGATNLSSTNSFTVVVNDVNLPPVLPAQTNLTSIALTPVVVTNTASDPNIPAVALSYGLVAGPTNAVIDTNGVITWTPVVAQVPSTNVFTTVVTNFNPSAVNAQHLTATNSFTVTVNAIHNGPSLPGQGNRTINELALLTVTNTATDADVPPLPLAYQLVSPPAGAVISTNGVITWTPAEGQGPSTNVITTVVTDNGTPNLSSTNSFTVVVNDINVAPVLPAQTNRTIIALTPVVVTNTASDPNIPAAALSYGLVSGPTNAVIDTNGVITWTPVVAQVPSTNVFTTIVTNFNPSAVNAQHLTATNSFTVFVNILHNGPSLSVQGNRTVNEFMLLTVTNTAADLDIPATTLTYQLMNPPAGAAVDTNGVITWTPAEGQGPSTNTITTVVTDNGTPALSATNSFTVVVNDVNLPPVLPAQTNRTIAGLATVVVTNTASDPNIPAAALSYGLVAGPTNAVIDTNGVITWTPVVAQVPSTNVFTTIVTNFNPYAVNAQHLTATNSFTVVVNILHNGPSLPAQGNRTVNELTLLTVTNTAMDADVPPLPLAYQLVNPPTGTAIDTNGVITWTPAEGQGPSTNVITTVVTDNGTPNLSATNSFTVVVNDVNLPPVLPAQTNRTIAGLATVVVTNTASDPNIPAAALSYGLVTGPTNAVIDTNGVITWTPVVAQVPSTNVFTTVVTNFNPSAVNAQHLTATNSFTVTVNAIHNGPSLPGQGNRTVNELTLLVVTNTAADADVPPLPLTYHLVSPPAGAAIDTNGVITWTPAEGQGPSTNTFTTVVVDKGSPPKSAANSFTVVVNDINVAPVLPSQTNLTSIALTPVVVTNTASDANIPAAALSYGLVTGPTNAVIDTNGVITWTPVVAQVPSTNVFTTIVTNFNPYAVNAQHQTATNSFTVFVNILHNGPVLPAQSNVTVNELTLLTVTNTAADSDIPANSLAYQLVSPPAGAAIDTNGVITWTPAEGQGPSTNVITTVVTDNGTPNLSATNSFMVVVNDINLPPVLPAQTNRTIAGLATVVVTNTASDPNIPAVALSYGLVAGPTNAVIDTNGVITWTPVVAQVPSTNVFTTVVTNFNPYAVNAQHLTATNSFTVTVNAIHNGPSLPAQGNRTINELTLLTVTNTAMDADVPPLPLAYQLVSPPAGVVISTNGVITWTPAEGQGPSTNVITTVVTDNGTPNLSATNSFTVVVNDINVAPVLPAQTNRTIIALTAVVVTNTASDANIPAVALSYGLVSGPTNAVIDTNGVISWTPVVAQVPSTNVFTTVVTNFNPSAVNAQHLTATNSFTVTVNAIHNGPSLPGQGSRTINELALLTVTNTATDADVPPLPLAYQLVSPPAGAVISTNGVITWAPAEGQGPSTNVITTVVTDNGTPNLSATNSFTVVVNDINLPPVLPAQTNRTIAGLATVVVTNTASDPNIPAAALSYGLVSGPTNAVIDTNGVITWTPVVAQVPSTNVFTTIVTNFNPSAVNAQHLTATNTFTVTVNAIHNGPSLPEQPDTSVHALSKLIVTNTAADSDIPTNQLSYLLTDAPDGASIDTNGVITWTPMANQAPGQYSITTVVVDNGSPPLTDANTFTVTVLPPVGAPGSVSLSQSNGTVVIKWSSIAGRMYRVQYKNDIMSTNWLTLPPDVLATGPVSMTTDRITGPMRFYRVVFLAQTTNTPPVLPAQANRTVNELAQLTVTNTATDSDIPADTLTYQLVSPPAGASIDTNGVITWTPAEGQGPSTNVITTMVTDYNPYAGNSQHLSATNNFTVVVNDINVPPVLPAQTNRTIVGLSPLVVTNTASDSNIPAATLTYGLAAGPTNATINANGVISWTPVVAQVPSTNVFTTVVTNFNPVAVNAQHLTATNTFTVTVNAIHNGPSLAAQPNRTVNEFALLTVTNTATDSDIPSLTLNYQLASPPSGATISAGGVITWTPGEGQGPSTNTITTVVTDTGTPALSATNSFIVVVNDINVPPVLPAQTNRTIAGLSPLVVTNTASDSNIPAATLTYGLISGPTNATIDANGVISWTPVVAQVPGTNVFTTVVTNFNPVAVNAQHLTATNTFTVTVNAIHNGPSLPAQANRTVNEFAPLTATNTASDSDIPALTLNYQLVSPPTGASISAGGVITWTPAEGQGPSTNTITTVVTDNGSPNLSATNSFTVVVNDINVPPVLPAQTNRTIAGLSPLVVTNTASDSNVPAATLTYGLVSGPTNATINANGVISWTPVVAQVPSTNVFTTVVTNFNPVAVNAQHLTATNTFTVTVNAIHNGPSLAAQPNRTVNEFALLTVTNTATDSDIPALTLNYQLVSPPTGATISASGVITWTPAEGQGPSTNTITTIVTDNGTPALSATNSFIVVVNDINVPPVLPSQTNRTIVGLSSLVVTNTATDPNIPAATLTYGLVAGPTNATIDANGVISWTPVVVQVPSTNVFTTVVTNFNPVAVNAQHLTATNSFTVTVNAIHNGPSLPAQANRTVNELTLMTVTNTASDSDIPALSLTYQLLNPPSGASISANGIITWTPPSGSGPSTNTITTRVVDNGAPQLSATNSFTVVVPASTNAPPLVASLAANGQVITITWNSTPGRTYRVQYKSNIASTNWSTLPPDVLANSTTSLKTDSATNSARFYRVVLLPANTNTAPVLPPQTNRTVAVFGTLTVTNTATDSDIPAQILTYQLQSPPTGATIDTNGVITWTPGLPRAGTTNTITTVVTDNGTPPLSATNSFTVVVTQVPAITASLRTSGTNVIISWNAIASHTYRVQYKNLVTNSSWSDLAPDITAAGSTASATNSVTVSQRYYRVKLLQ